MRGLEAFPCDGILALTDTLESSELQNQPRGLSEKPETEVTNGTPRVKK